MISEQSRISRNFGEDSSGVKEKLNIKQFCIGKIKITYKNSYEILEETDGPKSAQLKINNFLCHQEQNSLNKITDIRLHKQKIIIKDVFQIEQLNSSGEDEQESCQPQQFKGKKNIHLMKKDPYLPGYIQGSKKDTKNIVKNIVKMFMNWIQMNPSQPSQRARQQMTNILKSNNYNNKLIFKMAKCDEINHSMLNNTFKFLEQKIRLLIQMLSAHSIKKEVKLNHVKVKKEDISKNQ